MKKNTEIVPEKISKITALLLVALMVISGSIGYTFGLDKGYKKGLFDAGQRPMQQQAITMP